MAKCALSGHVHLFLTTNFDRLLEKALDDVGIVPQVLSTPDSIRGAVPFGHTKCTVVKLNGDYMDTRIKNTPKELEVYDPAFDSLLDKVIDQYGFIVSGWSAEWDAALRAAFERNQNQRYTMFWASRNPPNQDAVRLIEQRHGEFIKIKDPDTFFTGIGESLAKLEANVIPASDRASPGEQEAIAGSHGFAQGSDQTGLECFGCQALNPLGAKFCSSCENALARTCPECGSEASAQARFCLTCGHQLTGDSTSTRAELPTGLITYLFADVEGSTRLWQQYPHLMNNVMARHDSLLTTAVETNGGTVVRPRGEGDSIFAVFIRATDAVVAACDAQRLLLEESWPGDIAVNVRMAMHTGESELRDHDYYGTAVNRCARIRSIAHGGQVVLSQATSELVQDSLPEGVRLLDKGVHNLREMERPEQVFQLLHPDLPSEFPPLKSISEGVGVEQQLRFCTSLDGISLCYATVGEGPPLVKAPNWLSHLEFDWRSPVWSHWWEELAKDHTLVRFDQRGCGLSDWSVQDISFDAWVRDLESVVDALELERFALLGISQGGAAAVEYAVRNPDRVSHLVLMGSYVQGAANRAQTPEEAEEREALLTLMRRGWGRENPTYRQIFTEEFIPDATVEQMDWFNEMQRVSASPENAVRTNVETWRIDISERLPQVTAPTLVLHGRNDARVPFEQGRKLAALIPNARFVPLDTNNHLLLKSEPAWPVFLSEVRRFLGKADVTG